MEDMRLKFYNPVVTGTPNLGQIAQNTTVPSTEGGDSFRQVLHRQLEQESGVSFSKHAVKRAIEHNIDLSGENLNRLNEGVQLAQEKNLNDTLILVGGTAFVVNVKNNTVITAMGASEIKGNVFTNITGTVIV